MPIRINYVENECDMCNKMHDPITSEIFQLKGRVYCLCKDCALILENYLKRYSERKELNNFWDQ